MKLKIKEQLEDETAHTIYTEEDALYLPNIDECVLVEDNGKHIKLKITDITINYINDTITAIGYRIS